jgi:hypothetical protein
LKEAIVVHLGNGGVPYSKFQISHQHLIVGMISWRGPRIISAPLVVVVENVTDYVGVIEGISIFIHVCLTEEQI